MEITETYLGGGGGGGGGGGEGGGVKGLSVGVEVMQIKQQNVN